MGRRRAAPASGDPRRELKVRRQPGAPNAAKAVISSESRRLHIAVFVANGKVGFAVSAARVYIHFLAQDKPFALRNPDLVIALSMRGIVVRGVERRAFAIHWIIAHIMTGRMGIFPVPLSDLLKLRGGKGARAPLAVVQDVLDASRKDNFAAHGRFVPDAGACFRHVHVVRRGEEFVAGVDYSLASRINPRVRSQGHPRTYQCGRMTRGYGSALGDEKYPQRGDKCSQYHGFPFSLENHVCSSGYEYVSHYNVPPSQFAAKRNGGKDWFVKISNLGYN